MIYFHLNQLINYFEALGNSYYFQLLPEYERIKSIKIFSISLTTCQDIESNLYHI